MAGSGLGDQVDTHGFILEEFCKYVLESLTPWEDWYEGETS